MALVLNLQRRRNKSTNENSEKGSSERLLPVKPEDLLISRAYRGSALQIAKLVVGPSVEIRRQETERWEGIFADPHDQPVVVAYQGDISDGIIGVARFQRVREISVNTRYKPLELYVTPPREAAGLTDRMSYTFEACERMLGTHGLSLADLTVSPLPHDASAPQNWQYGRPV